MIALDQELQQIKAELDCREERFLSPLATKSREGVRRNPDAHPDHRQAFAIDTDRILYSRAYTRYIDKTQVFSLIKNDHITHRVLHVQLVSKIGRTIGRYLGLNEDLIEAIALGHDIGHPPFGHDGERFLAELCNDHGLPCFQHNIQSLRFLDRIERRGQGLNLTLQTMDGILCHDGEIHNQYLSPVREKTFADLDEEIRTKGLNPRVELIPMTMEGCVVRISDTISYIGRDIEDAITLKLINREEIPAGCRELLGKTNGTIVYRLVTDIIRNGGQDGRIGFSPEVSSALKELKIFNYARIYLNPLIKKEFQTIKACYRALFAAFLGELTTRQRESAINKDFLPGMDEDFRKYEPPAAIVRDFIAGMTDEYFLAQAQRRGLTVPIPVQFFTEADKDEDLAAK